MLPIAPICLWCKNFNTEEKGFKCKAYPNGIPTDIITSKFIHNRQYAGDNGFQFMLDNEKVIENDSLILVDLFPNLLSDGNLQPTTNED